MRRSSTYILLALSLVALTAGCRRDVVPQGEKMHFSLSVLPASKGFLEADGLDVNNTRVKVFDFLTGFEGSLPVNGSIQEITPGQTVKYIDDAVYYDGGTYWPYTDGHEYRWTRAGTHRFFGWLDYDKSYNAGAGMTSTQFFGSELLLNETTLELTTPVHYFQALSTSPQYDFVYARQPIIRNAADKDFSDIPLQCKHLFTAISLTFENKSSESSVQITDLNTLYEGTDLFLHSGYASMDFSGTGEITPVYALSTDAAHPFFSAAPMSGKTIAVGERYDMFSGEKLTTEGTEQYYMTWPVTAAQIAPQTIIGQDIFGDPIYDPRDAILCISYRVDGGAVETSRVKFPDRDWKAGTKVQLNIEFTDKSIYIVSEVLPWDYNIHTMNFNTESITTPGGGSMKCNSHTMDSAKKIHLTTDNPSAECEVSISSLQGATLVIKKIGADPAYFNVVPSEITITGGRLIFRVEPSDLATGGVERTMQLSFTVDLPSGREIDGDHELIDSDRNYIFSRQ